MVLKVFKALWFLSVLAVLVNLLFVYASLPEDVILQDEATGKVLAKREFLFYAATLAIIFVNALVYLISKLFYTDEDLRAWFHGLIMTINFFFIVAMNLVQTYNSAEYFDYSKIAFVIYGSVILMILWASSWPLYLLYRKLFAKAAVA
jgi:hypothetical protein